MAVVPSAACTAEAVVVFLSCWIVVPRGGVVVLDRFDMSRVDGVRGVEQAAGDGLLDESAEDIVNDVFEIGEKSVNGVSEWQFVESAVVLDKAVLKFLCNWTSAVDVLVVAVQKAAKEVYWFVDSCSPPASGANTSYSSRKSKSRRSSSGTVSVATAFKNSLTEDTFCRASELVDTVSEPCCFARDAFYDRLT